MKVKCEYCGNYILDTDKYCETCGAVNTHLMRSADGVPKTIEELKAFAEEQKLPLEEMRFFIDMDYRGARAYGIYKTAEGNFVVYKNKDDGTRAIRYQGLDEAYAVNEIYQKLKLEVMKQREYQNAKKMRAGSAPTSTSTSSASSPMTSYTPTSTSDTGAKSNKKLWIILGIVIFIIILLICCCGGSSCGSSGSSYNYGSGGSIWDSSDSGSSSWWSSSSDDSDSGSSWWSSSSDNSWSSNWNSSSNWDWGSDSWNSGGSNWGSNW